MARPTLVVWQWVQKCSGNFEWNSFVLIRGFAVVRKQWYCLEGLMKLTSLQAFDSFGFCFSNVHASSDFGSLPLVKIYWAVPQSFQMESWAFIRIFRCMCTHLVLLMHLILLPSLLKTRQVYEYKAVLCMPWSLGEANDMADLQDMREEKQKPWVHSCSKPNRR